MKSDSRSGDRGHTEAGREVGCIHGRWGEAAGAARVELACDGKGGRRLKATAVVVVRSEAAAGSPAEALATQLPVLREGLKVLAEGAASSKALCEGYRLPKGSGGGGNG